MALVRFGNGVSEIRGSIAGNVFSRNGSGAIIRNRITPVNPQTQAQQDVRYWFAFLAARFADLTLAQKEAWDDYAKLLVFPTNKLGESITYSGRQAFQMCNQNLLLTTAVLNPSPVGYTFDPSVIITAPVMNDTEKPPPITFDLGDKSFNLAVTALPGGQVLTFESDQNFVPPSAADDIQAIIVEATPVMRPTIRNRKNKFRLVQAYDASAAAVLDIQPEYVQLYPQNGLVPGMTAEVRMTVVSKGGLRSAPAYVTATA